MLGIQNKLILSLSTEIILTSGNQQIENQGSSQQTHNIFIIYLIQALISSQLWLLNFARNTSLDIILHRDIFHFLMKNQFSNLLEHKRAEFPLIIKQNKPSNNNKK